jgi:hypothetical protein
MDTATDMAMDTATDTDMAMAMDTDMATARKREDINSAPVIPVIALKTSLKAVTP